MLKLLPALLFFAACSSAARFPTLDITGSDVLVTVEHEAEGWRYDYVVRGGESARVGVLQLILPVGPTVPLELLDTDARLDLLTTSSARILNFPDVIPPGETSDRVSLRSPNPPCNVTAHLSPDPEKWYDIMLADPKIRARVQSDDDFNIPLPRDPHEFDLPVRVQAPCV